MDALLANLNELYRDLTLAATNPSQAKQALGQVDVQVASLRSNVTRLPQPLAGMMDKVAKDAAGDASASTIAQLSDAMAQEVTATCQQVIGNRYPFAKSDREVPIGDFARLFAPNGVIDRFFSTNLAPLANLSGKTWTWRANPNMTRKLSDLTLRQFQQAAEIRDAFFPTGGGAPNVNFDVKLLSLNSNATSATLTVNGATIVSQPAGGAPATGGLLTPAPPPPPPGPSNFAWPGGGGGGATITLAPELPDQKSSITREGAWGLFRLIDDKGAVTPRGNAISVGFVVGGREVAYQVSASSLNNPLNMPSLRQFKCPNGL